MNLNTVTEVKQPRSAEEIFEWRDGYAWLAGGTWLFSTPQIGTDTLIDLESLRWPALQASADGLDIAATCTHGGARPLRRPGRHGPPRPCSNVLPLAAGVVQDLERRDGRRQHLHVAAGRLDDLAHRGAGRRLHAVAAGRGAAQGRGRRFRHRQSHECPQAGELLRSIHLPLPGRSPSASPSAAPRSPISGARPSS